MVFSSLLFLLLFLPVTVGVYFLLPKKAQNYWLLVVSLVFYAWGEPAHIFIMLITTAFLWVMGLCISHFQSKQQKGLSKLFLILSIVFSLGILMYFKYTGFLVSNLPFLADTGIAQRIPALPIGISFYTFQALSYIIDVYRGNVKVQKNWGYFTMYISLFPQLIAGPIVRYSDVAMQIENRQTSFAKIAKGLQRFILGLGKKVLLANQMGLVWEALSRGDSVLGAWMAAIAFAFQIYFDFSAYSDMAIGLGNIFGFDFTENFRYPYQSASITDFWRRWHMTLGTWFREYVYIPLGGNRKGLPRQVLNLLIVWFLTGFWHGAAWQFIFWGLYYFAFLCMEKLFLLKVLKKLPGFVRHLYSLLVVVLGWVLFACADVAAAGELYKAMFGIGVAFADPASIFTLISSALLLIICGIGATDLPKRVAARLETAWGEARFSYLSYAVLGLVLLASLAFLVADSYNPFLYFRF